MDKQRFNKMEDQWIEALACGTDYNHQRIFDILDQCNHKFKRSLKSIAF
jgi:hypothetical protein